MIEELLAPYPMVTELRLSWGQMDSFQHINNVVYLHYFEDARLDYMERMGIDVLMAQSSVGPILASVSCNFRFPLTYPDTVSVGTRVTRLGRHSFTMEYVIVSQRHERLAADGDGVVVAYDYTTNQKARLPDGWRARIIELEERADSQAAQRLAGPPDVQEEAQ
jgi:acyl-CoA thioester hydrolase